MPTDANTDDRLLKQKTGTLVVRSQEDSPGEAAPQHRRHARDHPQKDGSPLTGIH
ncbi:hypothetical protein [Saccharothrix xinjiangensis]|uniref:Uncharacterized protein n=1 Tax=Saccharothrix xinjiangensis TaxID=204798 RepID=A0ABV9XZ41_9PSEU